jgi:hypothetical protein
MVKLMEIGKRSEYDCDTKGESIMDREIDGHYISNGTYCE